MVVTLIILITILVAIGAFFIMKKLGMTDVIFGNSIAGKVQKRKKLEGQIQVLKKQQKVESENVLNTYAQRKQEIIDSTEAQILEHKNQIEMLKANKESRCKLLDEERKVTLDRTINEFDAKISAKQNEVKKLIRYIHAEQGNINDLLEEDQPNAPRQLLIEDKSTTPAPQKSVATKNNNKKGK